MIGARDLRAFCRPPMGVPVSFAGGNTYPDDGTPICGIFEQVGKDAEFGSASVSDADYRLMLPFNAFSPFPRSKDTITVLAGFGAGTYKVRSVSPVDDGQMVELGLETT